MDVVQWVNARGGIVHRQQLLNAGVSAPRLRHELSSGPLRRIRRYWVATSRAPALLIEAARATGRVACVSAARHRHWWVPPDADGRAHLTLRPHAAVPAGEAVLHWSLPLVPVPAHDLVESVYDSLEHIAACLPREHALVLWESASRTERVSPLELRRVTWREPSARALAAVLTGESDSGLETVFVTRLGPWGLPIRQQVVLAGHRVDVLIGDRLVVQLDGFAHHSSSAERSRDVAHDRELVALGYTVLRFTYSEVLYNWPKVERDVARAVAQGRHLIR